MASNNGKVLYDLPNRIRETRNQKGMTQTDLGLAMGTNKSAISKLEKGEHVPDLQTVAQAADAMDTPMDTWFRQVEDIDSFMKKATERAKKISPEKIANFEAMINAALGMADV